jgi:hypothetical protein
MSDAEADAVAIFHPVDREALLPFLDLDEDSDDDGDSDEDSDGIYAEELEDGSFLLFTFQPYAQFMATPAYGKLWLAQFGEEMGQLHDDPRGVLFFPDTVEPDAQTYAAVVAEVGDKGVFVQPTTADEAAAALAGIDPALLQALAEQLLGASPGGSTNPPTSFDIGKLLGGMQAQLMATMGMDPDAHEGHDGADIVESPENKAPKKPAT